MQGESDGGKSLKLKFQETDQSLFHLVTHLLLYMGPGNRGLMGMRKAWNGCVTGTGKMDI
jgi:hypothetical protein